MEQKASTYFVSAVMTLDGKWSVTVIRSNAGKRTTGHGISATRIAALELALNAARYGAQEAAHA